MTDETSSKSGWKGILIKTIGIIVIALISSYNTYMTHKNDSDTDKNKADTIRAQESMLDQINKIIIPSIQRELNDLKVILRENSKVDSSVRERLAKLEGIIEGLPRSMRHVRHTAPPDPTIKSLSEVLTGAVKKIKEEAPIMLPTMQVQQMVKSISEDSR